MYSIIFNILPNLDVLNTLPNILDLATLQLINLDKYFLIEVYFSNYDFLFEYPAMK